MFTLRQVALFSLLIFYFAACSKTDQSLPLFQKMDPAYTGIHFENKITTNDSVNVHSDIFIYNGAGVAIGDINNSGYPDIFLSGNMEPGRLYLNKGNFQFEDITESAGIITSQWVTGASMVDINSDGYLDIYLSVSGPKGTEPEERANKLFLNNGDNTFREAASEYQIDDMGFTTHAAFLDFNNDGYLDLFLLGNSPGEFGRGDSGIMSLGARNPNPYGFDQLYKNNGDGTFTNVSEEAGILKKLGYGLGVVVTDINNDGWPDIYVSNDITPNDVLYVNNGDGTFTDRASDWIRHSSFAGMGMDIADFTNNGWPDIMQTDMNPADLQTRKRVSGSNTMNGFNDLEMRGYFPHFNLNVLQLNQGVTNNGDVIFNQISRMAGVSQTDWCWSVLLADYDNDGLKDLLITNGYPKAVNDFDYQSDMFNARRLPNSEQVRLRELEILENLHSYKVSNFIFKNNGDLTFENKAAEWGLDDPGFSNGAAYADLNNDGRLDLVINNFNVVASVYQNLGHTPADIHTENQENPTDNEITSQIDNYLQVKLKGDYPNIRGIGSKIYLSAGGIQQYIYHSPYRGFMSTMDDRAHFGMGSTTVIDSLEIVWPDGRYQVLKDITPNQIIHLDQSEAINIENFESRFQPSDTQTFSEMDAETVIDYQHLENFHSSDYGLQPLLPYEISKQGPVIAVADINGDSLDDLYIGGERNIPGKLFLQRNDGTFIEQFVEAFIHDSAYEDRGALFFDANGNGLYDLYVASGSYQSIPGSELFQDRLYINQGDGQFVRNPDAVPPIQTPTAAVITGDFTGNGQPDLFVGGRIAPGNYPMPVRSYILENRNGMFVDITDDFAPELSNPVGMITDAIAIDFTGDGRTDLITVGEWMGIHFYENDGQKLNNITSGMNLPPLTGWWYSIVPGDFNGDGLTDFAAGNLGLNYSYRTDKDQAFSVYADDFSENGTTDILFTLEIENRDFPYYGLAYLGREMIPIATAFDSFESFSHVSIDQIFSSNRLQNSTHYKADTFASAWFENNGDGSFSYHQLPIEAQIAPVLSMVSIDSGDHDCQDLIIAGNIVNTEPNSASADAGNGLWLKCNDSGTFEPVPVMESGLYTTGDVRSLAILNGLDKKFL
ncbi:MAG: VCBS repeat-containing protein, partial [Balneolaceae bacterium]